MVEATREFGVYEDPDEPLDELTVRPHSSFNPFRPLPQATARPAGACVTWQEHLQDISCEKVQGNPDLAERVWKMVDANGATYIWQMLLSF
jgi:hypothetical protein